MLHGVGCPEQAGTLAWVFLGWEMDSGGCPTVLSSAAAGPEGTPAGMTPLPCLPLCGVTKPSLLMSQPVGAPRALDTVIIYSKGVSLDVASSVAHRLPGWWPERPFSCFHR